MKYSTENALSEILSRSERIVVRRSRRVDRILTGTVGVLFLALVLVIALAHGSAVKTATDSVYGAFLLSTEVGGYLLAAVIAFALGVAVTLLSLRRRKERPGSNGEDKNGEDKS